MGFHILWNCICCHEAMRVMAVPKQSWHWGYLRGLLVFFLKDFHSFFYFPYVTSCILSFIRWFLLVLLVPWLRLGDSSTLLSHQSPSCCPHPCLPALHIAYLEPSFDHPLYKVASLQQVRPMCYPQISNNDLTLQDPSPTVQWWTTL
jgi:hypothetical protein